MYDQLMVELRNEETASFKNFLRMPTEMYDEIVARVGPRITKQHTRNREPLEPGLPPWGPGGLRREFVLRIPMRVVKGD